jgi:hypothetical protein
MRLRGSSVAIVATLTALCAFASTAAGKPAPYTVKTLHFTALTIAAGDAAYKGNDAPSGVTGSEAGRGPRFDA